MVQSSVGRNDDARFLPRRIVVATVALGWLLTGCGDRVRLYHAEGMVVGSDGRVFREGRIETRHLESGLQAHGNIDRDGRFQLVTRGHGKGALPGRHQVIVSAHRTNEGHAGHAAPPIIPERYRDYATSNLEITVEPSHDLIIYRVSIDAPAGER